MLVPAAYAQLSGGDALAGIGGIGGGCENVPAPAPTAPPAADPGRRARSR